MQTLPRSRTDQRGFTVPEVLMVMVLVAFLATYAFFQLIRPQVQSSLGAAVSSVTTDLKNQQIKSMTGTTTSSPTSFGIYFETNRYTLFEGTTYNAADTKNFVVNLTSDLSFASIRLPSNTLLFAHGSGEVTNYATASSSVVIRSSVNNEQKTIQINPYGALTIQ